MELKREHLDSNILEYIDLFPQCFRDDIRGHINNNTPYTIYCWWCSHPPSSDTLPVPQPVRFNKRTNAIICRGYFCSFNCCKADLLNKKNQLPDSATMVTYLCKKLTGKLQRIPCAPPPCMLDIFGGHLDINQFRKQATMLDVIYVVEPKFICYEHVCVNIIGRDSNQLHTPLKASASSGQSVANLNDVSKFSSTQKGPFGSGDTSIVPLGTTQCNLDSTMPNNADDISNDQPPVLINESSFMRKNNRHFTKQRTTTKVKTTNLESFMSISTHHISKK